jgi:hypothetical protein
LSRLAAQAESLRRSAAAAALYVKRGIAFARGQAERVTLPPAPRLTVVTRTASVRWWSARLSPRGAIMSDVSSFRDVTSFDSDLQMFRQTAKPVNVEHLQFLRWLIEHGRLDHPSTQPPDGAADEAAVPHPQ